MFHHAHINDLTALLYQLIFANIKHLNAKGDSVERITLEQFRDDVVLCTDVENVIQNIVQQSESVYEIPRSVIQMLLVLGTCYIFRCYLS